VTLDQQILHWINIDLANPLFDAVLPVMSELRYFIPLALALVVWMAWRDGVRGRVTVLALILLIPITDQVSSHVIKPAVNRPRPCHQEAGLDWVEVRTHCGSGRSFPSSHATNMGGVALLLGWRYRRGAWVAATFAFLVGLSRIYLGLHYPLDVVGGWSLGMILAAPLLWLGARFEGWWRVRRGGDIDEMQNPA